MSTIATVASAILLCAGLVLLLPGICFVLEMVEGIWLNHDDENDDA